MDLLKPTSTSQPQQQPSTATTPERVPSGEASASAGAPGRQRDAVSVDPAAVPAPAPVGEVAREQRRTAELNAERMRELAKTLNRELEFRVADSGRAIIDVVDTETGEVIRTIPPDDQQRLIDALAGGDLSLLPVDGAA
ncbi:MAG: flagellar protein FlaG [Pseudomonadota bacterium]